MSRRWIASSVSAHTAYNLSILPQRCLQIISERFPGSPRVDCLTGIRMEATEAPEFALKYYEELLEADPANSVSSVVTLRLSFHIVTNLCVLGYLEEKGFNLQAHGQD